MKEFVIQRNEAGQRFDKYLSKLLSEAPKGFLYKMLRKKNILLNQKKAAGNEILVLGDQVKIFLSDETFEKFSGWKQEMPGTEDPVLNTGTEQPEKSRHLAGGGEQPRKRQRLADGEQLQKRQQLASGGEQPQKRQRLAGGREAAENPGSAEAPVITVLYEDENVIFFNKPAGVLSQPDRSGQPSMVEYLIDYLLREGSITREEMRTFHPSVVNRLDKNTTGIIAAGKSLAGLQALSALFRNRTMEKWYLAVCEGEMKEEALVEGYLVKDHRTNKVRVLEEPRQGAEAIRTFYRPVRSNGRLTLLETELLTGKPHQIRAHLSSLGHPLLGDRKYGSRTRIQGKTPSHQLLHAQRLVFPELTGVLSPLSRKEICAPLPEEFRKVLLSEFKMKI